MREQMMQTQPMRTQPVRPQARPTSRGHGCLSVGIVLPLLLALGAVGLFAAWMVFNVALGPYEGRIYPNVYVADVDLGGLTPEEAAERLAPGITAADLGSVLLSAGERSWGVPWWQMGMRLDSEATAQAAYAIGRADQGLETMLSILMGRCEVAPVFVMEPDVARAMLAQLAPEVYVAPVEATLRLEGEHLVAVPGQTGQALDVEPTLEKLMLISAYAGSEESVAMTLRAVVPHVTDAGPAQVQAEAMLTHQVSLSTYDVLTGEFFSWTLGREEMARWLTVGLTEDGTALQVRVDEHAVRATLTNLASALGEGRGFRLDEAAEEVMTAFDEGGGTVELYLTHPSRTYTVQFGDRLMTIAAQFGMPPGLIAEANPNVDLDWLTVGQQLVIPSQDILTPYIPTPGKRIVVSIPEQRMRVYENGTLLYDWPVSTGIDSSPTYTGIFQVLDKEENAYASQWDLWMPHFIAVYRAGGDVYNGIHALPILSSGQRLWVGLLGSPASYGCIILGIDEAESLFNWADIGVVMMIE